MMAIRRAMTHVLETGFEYMEANNPNGSPKVRGYNIINGNLTLASDGATYDSTNPAWLDDCLGEFPLSTKSDVHDALAAARAATTPSEKREVRMRSAFIALERIPNWP